jgi:hypothetical protein
MIFWRFIGFLRAFAPLIAEMARMRYATFLVFTVLSGISRSICFTLLGYCFGKSWPVVERCSGKIGLALLFVFVPAFALYWGYRAVLSHYEEIAAWWKAKYLSVASSSVVQRLVARHPQAVSFFKHRLSPEGYFGLHFFIGLAVSLIFLWAFFLKSPKTFWPKNLSSELINGLWNAFVT